MTSLKIFFYNIVCKSYLTQNVCFDSLEIKCIYSFKFSLNFGFMRTFLLSKFEKGFINLVWALGVYFFHVY